MASPAGSNDDGGAAVCCMCGDHGLRAELFRCSLCRLRLQHRYCSELYPRAVAYRSCNWCLREEGGGDPPPPVIKAPTTAGAKRNLDDSRDDVGCTRSEFSPERGKPVKKPKKVHERMPERPSAAKGRSEVQVGSGRKARFRVKVRRYKLLAEVIC